MHSSYLSRQDQIGLQLYFRERLIIYPKRSVYVLANSPWQLVIEPVSEFWRHFSPNREIKDEWSVGLCDPYTPGMKIKKKWTQCTTKEVIKEVWVQICMHFFDSTISGEISGKNWKRQCLVGGYFQNTMKENPKTSPNAKTYWLRPHSPRTNIPCFFLAGDYVLANANSSDAREVTRMELACTSGKIAANCVFEETESRFPNS